MEQLLEILEDIKPGVDFKNQQHLATGGILRSFDILSLVSEIQEEFGVDIPVDIVTPEHFESLESIMALIEASRE